MRYVGRREFELSREHGFTGIYIDYDGEHPEWKGKRTIMTGRNGPGTTLYIEGVSFEVVDDDDPRCPKEFVIEYFLGVEPFSPKVTWTHIWFKNMKEAERWARENKPFLGAGMKVSRMV